MSHDFLLLKQGQPETAMSYYDHFDGEETADYAVLAVVLLIILIILAGLFSGCAARPAIKPGHDRSHPALTPVGKVTCKVGILKLFGSYGPRNCKNEEAQ